MGLETKDKQIGRYTYEVTQLGFKEGRAFLARVFKILGPVVSELVKGGAKVSDVLNKDGRGAAGAIFEISQQLSEADLTYACGVMGKKSCVVLEDGKKPQLSDEFMELHFAGHYDEMFKWLLFAVEVNYGSFFGGKGLLGGGA